MPTGIYAIGQKRQVDAVSLAIESEALFQSQFPIISTGIHDLQDA